MYLTSENILIECNGGILSGGDFFPRDIVSGGFCPEGFCPRTKLRTSVTNNTNFTDSSVLRQRFWFSNFCTFLGHPVPESIVPNTVEGFLDILEGRYYMFSPIEAFHNGLRETEKIVVR